MGIFKDQRALLLNLNHLQTFALSADADQFVTVGLSGVHYCMM